MTAFDAVSQNTEDVLCGYKRIAAALCVLAKKAGIYGMIGGQVVDIESEEKPAGVVSMDTIKFIHENKTAAMIESSLMIGAILAGASDDEIKAMEKTGSDVGLAFQIQDDILDVTGNPKILGKPVGSDEKNHKTTYVTIKGLETASADVAAYSRDAIEQLQKLDKRNEFLEELIRFLINRDR
jgi:geranylgeranyl diphosphate synthase type II